MAKPSPEPPEHENHPILLYDGVCGLCQGAVQFILKRDRGDLFRFASLQSDFAAGLLQRHGLTREGLDTVYLVLHYGDPSERLLSRSQAGLAVMLLLGGVWRLLASVGGVFPRFLLDFLYSLVARHRYRIFGRYPSCPLPTPERRAKFLDQ